MTFQKKAEEINKYLSGFHSPLDRENYIAQALTAFANEQNADTLKAFHLQVELEVAIRRRARAEALEEAAKEADKRVGAWSVTMAGHAEEIAKAIRALRFR